MRRAAAVRLLSCLRHCSASGNVKWNAGWGAECVATSTKRPSSLPDHGRSWAGWHGCAHSTTAAPTHGLREFRLAQTGEGIKECELVQWFIKEGDTVEEFERMCEVQSDKATIEITSPFSGMVKTLHHAAGDVVQVGEILAHILSSEADPASDSHPAGAAGSSSPGSPAPATHTAGTDHPDRVLTSPAVRHLARELGVDLAAVAGTGPSGRLTKGDVLAFADSLGAAATSPISEDVVESLPTTEQATVAAMPPLPHFPAHSKTEAAALGAASLPPEHQPTGPLQSVTLPLRGYRRAMVRSMTAAGHIPHFHLCDDVKMDVVVELRARLRDAAALHGAKLTYMPFFIKAAAAALREFPLLNSSLGPDGSSLLQHGRINIGVAVATPLGLAVPNIKDVGEKSVAQVAAELQRLSEAAASNQLRPDDITGGTFTLSNIGSVGGMYATPLINPPEVAILALGKVQRVPRFAADGCSVVAAHVLGVSLGADHRVVDGAALAGFLQKWKGLVEDPARLLLTMR